MIKRCFTNRSQETITLLYKSIIRPTLEYASPTWSPWYEKDKDLLEKNQKRCLSLSRSPIHLPSLESRRNEADLCETFKYMKNKYKTPGDTLFSTNHTRTGLRGHDLKLFKRQISTDVAKNFLTHRIVKDWNALPAKLLETEEVQDFKENLRSLLHA